MSCLPFAGLPLQCGSLYASAAHPRGIHIDAAQRCTRSEVAPRRRQPNISGDDHERPIACRSIMLIVIAWPLDSHQPEHLECDYLGGFDRLHGISVAPSRFNVEPALLVKFAAAGRPSPQKVRKSIETPPPTTLRYSIGADQRAIPNLPAPYQSTGTSSVRIVETAARGCHTRRLPGVERAPIDGRNQQEVL